MRGIRLIVIAALLTGIAASAANAAAFLWWKKVITKAIKYDTCMKNAQRVSLTGIQVKPDEVSGYSIDRKVYVAITCVARNGERAIAIVAGVGEDSGWVKQVVEATADEVRTAGVPEY